MAGNKHALLIGIDHYPKLANADLQGCRNDAELMRSLLEDRFRFAPDHIRVLLDEDATQTGIRAGLHELAGRAEKDDIVVLGYAGHGSRMRDPRDSDRMIESMVSSDSGRGDQPNRDILDEEIDRWVQQVNEKTPYVTLLFDCCHSGSVTRDAFGEATREVEPDLREVSEMFGEGDLPPIFATSRAADDRGQAGWVPGRRRAVVVAACRADELANEHRFFDGHQVVRHGALSYFLGQALLDVEGDATWRDIFERLAPAVTSRYGRQHPQLEGKVDELLFGTEQIRPAAYLKVRSVAGGTVELGGGAAHGVTTNSIWSIRAHGTRSLDSGDEVAQTRIESVEAAVSWARVDDSSDNDPNPGEAPQSDELQPGMRAFLRQQQLPQPGFRVALDTPGEKATERDTLESLLASSDLLELADSDSADVLVRCLAPRQNVTEEDPCPGLGPLETWTWAALGRDGRLAVRSREEQSSEPADLEALTRDLVRLARYQRLLDIDNPDPASTLHNAVHLRVRTAVKGDAGPAFVDATPQTSDGLLMMQEGEGVEIEIQNRHSRTVFVTLVQFGSDGAITRLMPFTRHSTYQQAERKGGVEIEPGGTASLREYFLQDARFAPVVQNGLQLHLPEGFPWAAEANEETGYGLIQLKLLVTLEDADFEFLEQERVRFDPQHPLQHLALLYHSGQGMRSLIPEPVAAAPEKDWATLTVALGIQPKP